MDGKQQAFNPGYPTQPGYPQQQPYPPQPPPYSEIGGSAYPPYPAAGGFQPQGGFQGQGGGYPMGGSGYPPGPGYGAAPMGMGGMGMPGVGFPSQPGYGMGFGGGPMGPPMGGFRVPLDPQDQHEEPKPYDDMNNDGMAFSEKSIRMAFIRKVYSILMVQLLATTGIIALFCFHSGVKSWIHSTPAFMWVCYAIAIVLMFAIACCENVRRRAPANIIVLGLFTLTYGVVVATIASRYNADVVVLAAGITVVVCLALTLFSFQTKIDFTAIGGTLFVCVVVLFLFGILAAFLRHKYPILHLIYAAGGTLLFSIYLVHDTQMMMGGKHKYSISPEEYIFAALNIYTDIIMIFIHLLSLLGSKD